MWLFCLILLLSETNYAKKQECVDIVCDHDNVNVCGVRTEGEEVSFRLFQDECALRKFGCESGTKGFKTINVNFCNHALNLEVETNKSVESFATEKEEVEDRETEFNTDTTFSLTDTTDTLERTTCIKCYCDSDSNKICAIRADSSNFIVRWFPDKCHMLQYNCEHNLNFTVTDTYICIGDEKSENLTDSEEIDTKTPDNLIDTKIELSYKMDDVVFENPACSQDDCISDNKVICAVNPDEKGFVIRRFNDECHMLQHNCEKQVNFTTIDEVVCVGGDNFTINYTPEEESKTIEKYFTTEVEEATDVQLTEKTILLETTTLSRENNGNSSLPNNVVVSTFDLNEESINQTVNNFFAASHSTGIPIKKLVNEDTRRMIIQNTGPFNIFVPRAFIPANWTKPSLRNESKKYPEWTPLLKYCYHKCPEKCPDFYRPVCGAKLTDTKQTPFVFYKNHCYMDIAKCKMSWGGYTGYNYTELEEMGFIFCGGYKMMNMVYMYPLIKILQRMGRLNKKGRVHFVMKNLGQFPIPLQG